MVSRCFKTTTVGLRRDPEGEEGRRGQAFQNHYGWIETSLKDATTLFLRRFKTTTVGLRRFAYLMLYGRSSRFKTTTVGLRPGHLLQRVLLPKVSKPLRLD